MNALQVHITHGPQAGARLQISQSPVTFGRSPENTLVLDLPLVSRQHGELQFVEGQWLLVNHSQNGTRINRKRVTKKPRELVDGASIFIGDEEIFRVYFSDEVIDAGGASNDASEADAQQPTHIPGSGLKGRSKIWLYAAVWFGVMICLFVLLFTFLGDKDETDTPPTNAIVLFEDADEILALLQEMPPRKGYVAQLYDANIREARQDYETNPRRTYDCYEHYRIAIQNMPDSQNELIGEDMLRYAEVEQELAEIIELYYSRAYDLWKAGRNVEAVQRLDELQRLFSQTPGEQNPVANAIAHLRQAAAEGIED